MLNELYQEVIIDHNRSPRNFRKIDDATSKAEGYNPLCGDRLVVYLKLENGLIADLSFEGAGCAISVASASLMTELLKGKTEQEAEAIFNNFHQMVTGTDNNTIPENLGKLAVLSGVKEFPARVKCASLCWHTLHSAIADNGASISTE